MLKQQKHTTMHQRGLSTENIIYKCIVSILADSDKAYLWTIEKVLWKIYLNQRKPYMNTTLAKYICEHKQIHNRAPTLKWYIVESVPSYCIVIKALRFVSTEIWNSDFPKLSLTKLNNNIILMVWSGIVCIFFWFDESLALQIVV